MPRTHLTPSGIDRLRPRRKPYSVRDTACRGFGVHVATTGRKHFFLQTQHEGKRSWHHCGDAARTPLADARARAVAIRSGLRGGGEARSVSFELVAEEVFRRYGLRWKPRTLRVNQSYYRNQILPWFRGRPIASITEADVHAWFGSLRATPVAADRSAPVLSVILRQAEVYGYRPDDSNPCRGIRRYRRRGRERFLMPDELRRLGAALDQLAVRHPLATAVIRLLLLTGCRKSELLDLEWTEYREGKLFLRDSKTGPRTVWLSAPARAILDAVPRRGRQVFRGPRGGRTYLQGHWEAVRREAGLEDVRLHDCRHTFASVAMEQGESLRTIGQLLGHRQPDTTLKYLHLSDASPREAVERLGPTLAGEG